MRKRAMTTLMAGILLMAGGGAVAQMPGGLGGGGGMGRGSMGAPPVGDDPTAPVHDDKPDIAARKAFAAGQKALEKGKALVAEAQQAGSADRKSRLMEKAGDAFDRALEQFTLAISNKGDMAEAWNGAGYVHLFIGAYREALDDYDHNLQFRPGDMDAIANRAEAWLHLGRLDDVQAAYMDLYSHARERADLLMRDMQRWLAERREDPQGMRASDLDAFQRWIDERVKAAGS